jgi:hypothetical protein
MVSGLDMPFVKRLRISRVVSGHCFEDRIIRHRLSFEGNSFNR